MERSDKMSGIDLIKLLPGKGGAWRGTKWGLGAQSGTLRKEKVWSPKTRMNKVRRDAVPSDIALDTGFFFRHAQSSPV